MPHEYMKIILNHLHQHLKPMGYRKKGQVFSKQVDDVTLIIQPQSSSFSTKDSLKVTVNLGVFSWTLAERQGRNIESLSNANYHWSERIGYLMPERYDHWWIVNNEEEVHRTATEIVYILSNHVIPTLDTVSSTEKLKALWLSGKSPGLTKLECQKYLGFLDDVR